MIVVTVRESLGVFKNLEPRQPPFNRESIRTTPSPGVGGGHVEAAAPVNGRITCSKERPFSLNIPQHNGGYTIRILD